MIAVPDCRVLICQQIGQVQKMAAWLADVAVTDAAMESTGVYW